MFEFGVEDPFSGYMSPDDYQRALGDLSGQFSGIGAEMGVRNLDDPENLGLHAFSDICALVVVAPLEDSPAERAGLQAGDFVTAIDGESVDGLSLEDAIKRVRGESGTDVTLTLSRDDESLEMTITRAEIVRVYQPHARGRHRLRGAPRVLEPQLRAVPCRHTAGCWTTGPPTSSSTCATTRAAISTPPTGSRPSSSSGLVFTQESAADGVKRWEAAGEGLATDANIPVVVLVNNGSASASEIVAAALKERGRATVIGQHTYGKNTVQALGSPQ